MRPGPLAAFLLFAAAPLFHAYSGAVIREEGAIYLEDLIKKPIRLEVSQDAAIYYGSDLARYLGTIRKGQIVELQAVMDHAYRVRGRAHQGQVAGWVEPRFVTGLQPEFIASLKKNAERMESVKALIEKNEVAVNMTPEEVLESLGKPQKKSARVDVQGKQEAWEYIRYERVPQQRRYYDVFGRLVIDYIYVKKPVGQLAVIFENNLVTALEQSEGTLTRGDSVKIVVPPIEVRY